MTDIIGASSAILQKDFWIRVGHFLKWRIPAVILVFLIFRIISSGMPNLRTADESLLVLIEESSVKILSTELRIEPPDGTYIDTACFHQNEEGVDTMVERGNFIKSGVIKWNLENDGMYFCDALHGKIGSPPTLSTKDFPVYGDYVPEESSVWLIDLRGRVRIEANGIETKDFSGRWHHYPNSQYD